MAFTFVLSCIDIWLHVINESKNEGSFEDSLFPLGSNSTNHIISLIIHPLIIIVIVFHSSVYVDRCIFRLLALTLSSTWGKSAAASAFPKAATASSHRPSNPVKRPNFCSGSLSRKSGEPRTSQEQNWSTIRGCSTFLVLVKRRMKTIMSILNTGNYVLKFGDKLYGKFPFFSSAIDSYQTQPGGGWSWVDDRRSQDDLLSSIIQNLNIQAI